MLDDGLDAAPPGPGRVRGLLLAATIASWERATRPSPRWCEQALAEAGDDPLLLARCHATLAETSPSGAVEDLFHAERAVDLLESLAAPPADLLANALTNVAAHGLPARARSGRADCWSAPWRCRPQAPTPCPVNERAALGLGMYLKVVDRFDESRAVAARRCGRPRSTRATTARCRSRSAIWRPWSAGPATTTSPSGLRRRGSRARRAGWGCGRRCPASAHVLALAHLGRLDEARALGRADLAADESVGFTVGRGAAPAQPRRGRAVGRRPGGRRRAPAARAGHLRGGGRHPGAGHPARCIRTPSPRWSRSDGLDEAERLTEQLDVEHRGQPPSVVDRDGAALPRAAARPPRVTCPARSSCSRPRSPTTNGCRCRSRRRGPGCCLAGVLRRAGRRSDARRELEAARGVFDRLGTPVQARRPAPSWPRIGGRHRQTRS